MSRLLLGGVIGTAVLLSVALAATFGGGFSATALDTQTGPVLRRYASAAEFQRYLRTLEQRQREVLKLYDIEEPAPAESAAAPGIDGVAGQPANPEITNNQSVGVDEGGIVKQVGRFLVVLQDGRVFSADLGSGQGAPLRLADRIDVYRSPGAAASWYDEMLVLGNRILVTAYNYREQASEITVLRIDDQGRLSREGRFLLSSSDYYSTENYATRLVGDQLVFYAPHALHGAGVDGEYRWPRLRRADGDRDADEGEALIGPTDVYAPAGKVDYPVLHTVSICPLRQEMDCRTTAFIGPAMREFYVSPTDAFLWIGAPDGLPWSIDYANLRRQDCPAGETFIDASQSAAMLYRIPLDGGTIGAVAAEGVPTDQFAFDSRDGRFRALLARDPSGCTKPAQTGALALLDIPLSDFGTTIRHVSDRTYAGLPPIAGGQLENRFVGNWLVYGGRTDWSSTAPGTGQGPIESSLVTVPVTAPTQATQLRLPHNAVRIERAGSDAIVTGYGGPEGLSLSYVSLGRARPRVAATTLLPRRFESEGRSHAFNAWVRADGSGLIGIPTVLDEGRSGRGWSDSRSSELSFVAIGPDKTLAPAGELGMVRADGPRAYRCEVSCVDWYGNSRPIFTGGRIFALMGTDLVEGRMASGRIGEVGRLDLTGEEGSSGKRQAL